MSKGKSLKTWWAISVFLLTAGIGTSSVLATGTYDGGDGSEGNPFQINTPAQMDDIGQHSEDWGSYFILTADIDLSAYTGTAFHIIGNFTNNFTGFFNGNGHTISNFTYTSTDADYIGLFGYIGTGGVIKNLGMVAVNVDAGTGWPAGHYVGGLVGYNYRATVSNCYLTGNVSGNYYVGGLVGYNQWGTVSDCDGTGNVTGTYSNVGGLVGENYGTILNCYATSSVSGHYSVGGLVGTNWYAAVSNCYAAGPVVGNSDVGGLAGVNYRGTVSNSYAAGTVTGTVWFIGGLVGYNYWATVSNCYATGDVSADKDVGGLVGYNLRGTVSNCYATGPVSGTSDVGGLVGWNKETQGREADIFASFWDKQTTGQANGVGRNEGSGTVEVYGRTTAEMQTQSTFTDYGWDFVNIWGIDEGFSYPYLLWQIPPVVDTDVDGLTDEEELAGWDITIYDCEGTVVDSYHVTSDPCQADEDGDGLNDSEEKAGWHVKYRYQLSPPPKPQWVWIEYDVKSNPHEADIDNDGKNDKQEKAAKTDPNRANTDCDSAWDTNDGFEIDWGLNPLDFDTDGDGLSDGLEIDLWIISAGYSPDEPETVPFEVLEWAVSKTNDPVMPSFIDIDPDTLNLKSKGKFVTCYIELPEGYLVEEVDIDSAAVAKINDDLLDPPVYTVGTSEIGDYDNNGISDLMVKFDRQELIALLEAGDEVDITVIGELTDGTPFEGTDTIRVIDKGKSK